MITLKKIKRMLATAGVLACAVVSANAVDIKANIMLRGDLMRIEKDDVTDNVDYYYLLNNQANQIDNPGDGVEFDLDGGICGAHLALWYVSAKAAGENEWAAYFRRTYGWFKPIDSLTIRAGYVGTDSFFKEKIDEWKVGSPFAIMERDWGKHPMYINCNDVEGWGFGVEYKPVEGLILNAGITPGAKGSISSNNYADSAAIYNEEGDSKTYIAPWGAGAKYYWKDFEFQASYRNGGMDSDRDGTWSVARFGVGMNKQNLYAFVQPILGFDYNKADEKWEMNGMCFDLYGEYSLDAWTFMLHAPVTVRFEDEDNDKSYMELNAKIKYNTGSHGNLDDVAPYIQVGSNQDDAKWGKAYTTAWILDNDCFANSFNLSYTAGVNFKVGAAEIDVGVKYDQFSKYHKQEYKKAYNVSVPFMLKFKQF